MGNQLFAYAFGYALAKQLKTKFILDKQIYRVFFTFREYNLDYFMLDHPNALGECALTSGRKFVWLFRAYRKLLLTLKYRPVAIDETENYVVQKFSLDPAKNYYMTGYWQNYRYFHMYRSDLVRQFRLKDVTPDAMRLIDMVKRTKKAAMHIRRTDYANYKGGKLLSLSFYKEAIAALREKRGENVQILVFSDDVPFCKSNFPQSLGLTYVSDMAKLSDIEEFYLMSQCRDFIMANSSFSWWAAYLGDAPDKLVFAPVVDQWKKDFYPPEWTAFPALLEQNDSGKPGI